MTPDTSLLLAILVAIAPQGGPDTAPPGSDSGEQRLPVEIDFAARLSGGALSGQGVRPGRGGLVTPSAEAEARFERGPFRLEVPLSLAHEQTMGAHFPESRGSGALQLSYELARPITVIAEASLLGVWRPGWPDLYQPVSPGVYLPTDRYSHWDRRLGAELRARPMKGHRARFGWRYTFADYLVDPAYDPFNAPTHLAPLTYEEHSVRGSWRYLSGPFRVAGRAEAFLRRDPFLYARDAGTGATHAAPGGLPANPLQVRRGLEPGVEVEFEPPGTPVEASVGYGYEIVEDIFQGYYSFTGHHPEARVKARFGAGVELVVRGEVWLRRFGEGSYQAGQTHPPLLWGDRREDRKLRFALQGRVPISQSFAVFGEARLAALRTNLPPYEPGVYPVTREYDIDWSYTNWRLTTGLEWTYGGKSQSGSPDGG